MVAVGRLTRVDPGQLENAVLNLVVNARDAMPEGGRPTVETLNAFLDDEYAAAHAEVTPGQHVAIAVTDTGGGNAAGGRLARVRAVLHRQVERRGHGARPQPGLRLRQAVGRHVKIYGEAGRGATGKVHLRREQGVGRATNPAAQAAEPATPLGSPDEIVLVVEDKDDVPRAVVSSLRELGYTVRHARSGAEAFAVLEEQPGIRLLFTDVVKPGMTGRALADAAAARRPDLKVIYTTGYTPNAIVHNGVVDPGVALLTKPFALDQLARKVRKVLG